MRPSNELNSPVVISLDYNNYSYKHLQDIKKHEVQHIDYLEATPKRNPKESRVLSKDKYKSDLLFNFPTVYIINDEYNDSVYVGETNNILKRTHQHLFSDPINKLPGDKDIQYKWKKLDNSANVHHKAKIYIIGHDHFNKSMTMDIENRMMGMMTANNNVHLINGRPNNQDHYYNYEEMSIIFTKIWNKLRKRSNYNNKLFPLEKLITNSSIFKASPYQHLTSKQIEFKDAIENRVNNYLKDFNNHLILIEGLPGTGKTVLLSVLFYELNHKKELNNHPCYLVVNQNEQVHVYEQIAKRLGLIKSTGRHKIVNKPTPFLNAITKNSNTHKIDVLLIDEAHLLLTRYSQSYNSKRGYGRNELFELMKHARIVIAVFDPNQVLRADQYISHKVRHEITNKAQEPDGTSNIFKFNGLQDEMRVDANQLTLTWLNNFAEHRIITKIPNDDTYKLRICKNPEKIQAIINHLAKDEDPNKNGISRVVATFDWPYHHKKNHIYNVYAKRNTRIYWKMPWNYSLKSTIKARHKGIPWPEIPSSIKEVGSLYTVQGLDLNYEGLLLGPSVGYKNGRIVFHPENSRNPLAKQHRKIGKESVNISDELLNNELKVLLPRGVHGLFIYAFNKNLENALIKNANEHLIK